MDDFDVLNTSGSEDDEGAGERVRMIMEEIYKNQDKIKSEQDIEEMAERCTNMMMQMRNEAAGKKKEKKPHKVTAGGDKASPPASRASLKESPTKDSGKGAGYSPRQTTLKTALKEFEGKKKASKPVPNFTDLYKEKMEKLRVPGKGELKGLTKTDSTKKSKPKMSIGEGRRKMEKKIENASSESESLSSTVSSESESDASGELRKVLESSKTFDKIIKGREGMRTSTKEADAHKKVAEWMPSTREEIAKRKDAAGSSKTPGSKANKMSSYYSSSDLDSDEERLAQQLKSKMTLSSKKPPSENRDALKKLMNSMTEKPVRASVAPGKVPPTPLRRPSVPVAAAATRAAPTAKPLPTEKAKPRKKL